MQDDDGDAQLRLPIDLNRKIIAQIRFFSGTLNCYCPGPRLCEYIAPGRDRYLTNIEFVGGYNGRIPTHFAEPIDAVIIDWLDGRISGKAATKRLIPTIEKLQAFAATGSVEEQEAVANCITSLVEMCEKVFPKVSERLFALRWMNELRKSLLLPPKTFEQSLN